MFAVWSRCTPTTGENGIATYGQGASESSVNVCLQQGTGSRPRAGRQRRSGTHRSTASSARCLLLQLFVPPQLAVSYGTSQNNRSKAPLQQKYRRQRKAPAWAPWSQRGRAPSLSWVRRSDWGTCPRSRCTWGQRRSPSAARRGGAPARLWCSSDPGPPGRGSSCVPRRSPKPPRRIRRQSSPRLRLPERGRPSPS